MKPMRTEKAKRLVEDAKASGKFFSVLFIKRTTGKPRMMVCRGGVRKHLKGGEQAYDPAEKQLATVFDVQKGGYRTIPLDAVLEVSTDE